MVTNHILPRPVVRWPHKRRREREVGREWKREREREREQGRERDCERNRNRKRKKPVVGSQREREREGGRPRERQRCSQCWTGLHISPGVSKYFPLFPWYSLPPCVCVCVCVNGVGGALSLSRFPASYTPESRLGSPRCCVQDRSSWLGLLAKRWVHFLSVTRFNIFFGSLNTHNRSCY